VGLSADCVVAECVECADDAGPRRDTHGVFICDGRADSVLRRYLNFDTF
jgi:hypothetical protein